MNKWSELHAAREAQAEAELQLERHGAIRRLLETSRLLHDETIAATYQSADYDGLTRRLEELSAGNEVTAARAGVALTHIRKILAI